MLGNMFLNIPVTLLLITWFLGDKQVIKCLF